MTRRYDEAIRLFDEADAMMRADGEPPTDLYVTTFLTHKYDALQQAGRFQEALQLGESMRQLTDSLRRQERLEDVELMQAVRQQEEEIARKHQAIAMQRHILIAACVLLILLGFIIWRILRDNRLLAEKNSRLYDQIAQREKNEAEEQRFLQAQPEEDLTSEQLLYRRLCSLMTEQQPYTDENLNRDALARLLNTNATYVVQAIHECSHGETVMEFITRYRLEHVAHLLKTTDEPIAFIGELSGIPSRATLARLFRNAYGMSCSEYRQVAKRK
jgi:YesN/AraC family two-component response regulator